MRSICVQASKTYSVYIGHGILSQMGKILQETELAALPGRRAIVVTDDQVGPLYAALVKDVLADSGVSAEIFIFPHGEQSKNATQYIALLEFFAAQQLTRSDFIVALGGGVVGDLAGFAAATYLRGLPFVQIPTTLLAAVDSSVGGKTAIDLNAGKNLAGAFYQPSLVLCDLDTLSTLPQDVLLDGYAEVIKYGMIADSELLRLLESSPSCSLPSEETVARCVEIKRRVVEADERDTGERQLLNFGHTVGHSIEKLSNYTQSHGMAVAAGMGILTRAAVKMGRCPNICQDILEQLLQSYHLPNSTTYVASALAAAALSDKKRSGGTVNLILPDAFGHCEIVPTAISELEEIIAKGLTG